MRLNESHINIMLPAPPLSSGNDPLNSIATSVLHYDQFGRLSQS